MAYVWTWPSGGSPRVTGERSFIVGNYNTQKSSVQTLMVKTTGTQASALSGSSQAPATSGLLSTWTADTNSMDFSTEKAWQGCIDFNDLGNIPSSTDVCAGDTLAAPDAPLIDSSGSFSPSWLTGLTDTKMGIQVSL